MFLYGGLMGVITIVFAAMAYYYTYSDFSGKEEQKMDEDKMKLEEKGMTPASSTTAL